MSARVDDAVHSLRPFRYVCSVEKFCASSRTAAATQRMSRMASVISTWSTAVAQSVCTSALAATWSSSCTKTMARSRHRPT